MPLSANSPATLDAPFERFAHAALKSFQHPVWGYPFLTQSLTGGGTQILRRLRGGGTHFLRALFLKSTTPPYQEILNSPLWNSILGIAIVAWHTMGWWTKSSMHVVHLISKESWLLIFPHVEFINDNPGGVFEASGPILTAEGGAEGSDIRGRGCKASSLGISDSSRMASIYVKVKPMAMFVRH